MTRILSGWDCRFLRFCAKRQRFRFNAAYTLYNGGKIAINVSIIYIYYRKTSVASCRARSRAGLNTKIHLAVDAYGVPVRFFITDATVADCSIAEALIAEFQAEYLLADRGHDTDAIIRCALQVGMTPLIPPKKNRKVLRNYDKHIYNLRHLRRECFFAAQEMAKHCYALS